MHNLKSLTTLNDDALQWPSSQGRGEGGSRSKDEIKRHTELRKLNYLFHPGPKFSWYEPARRYSCLKVFVFSSYTESWNNTSISLTKDNKSITWYTVWVSAPPVCLCTASTIIQIKFYARNWGFDWQRTHLQCPTLGARSSSCTLLLMYALSAASNQTFAVCLIIVKILLSVSANTVNESGTYLKLVNILKGEEPSRKLSLHRPVLEYDQSLVVSLNSFVIQS